MEEGDADYWSSTDHTGFDFGENDYTVPSFGSKLPTTLNKNEDFRMLRYDGLNEALEEKTSPKDLSSQVLWLEEDKYVQKFTKKYNPLELNIKESKETLKLSPSQTIKNMVLGLNYTLEHFKGKEEKIELLNAAVKSHDGNTILTVVMFLKNTLKKSIFQREIGMYTEALNMYLSYLEEDHEIEELTNMYLLLDKPDAAAMTKFNAASSLKHADRKIKWLENCLSTHFQPNIVNNFLCASVIEHKQLLRDQVAVEEHHLASNPEAKENFDLFEQLTKERKLIDTSVMCSLVFCSLFYYDAAEAAFMSPSYTKTKYNLSKKQFTWGAVRALIATKRWAEMEALFISKNWLSGVKIRSCISLSKLLQHLSKMQAPFEIISKYVSCIENQDLKLNLAKKYHCHSIVIEIFKNNKDRIGLLKFKSSLPPHSVEFCTATDVLNNRNIKWKN